MRVRLLSSWWRQWRFDRDHRPFLTTRQADPIPLPDGSLYQPELELIFCTKHDCWWGECPA